MKYRIKSSIKFELDLTEAQDIYDFLTEQFAVTGGPGNLSEEGLWNALEDYLTVMRQIE
jgi:hypothetical protein